MNVDIRRKKIRGVGKKILVRERERIMGLFSLLHLVEPRSFKDEVVHGIRLEHVAF